METYNTTPSYFYFTFFRKEFEISKNTHTPLCHFPTITVRIYNSLWWIIYVWTWQSSYLTMWFCHRGCDTKVQSYDAEWNLWHLGSTLFYHENGSWVYLQTMITFTYFFIQNKNEYYISIIPSKIVPDQLNC